MKILSKTEAIVPGASIGGVCLGEDAAEIVQLFEKMGVAVFRRTFENAGRSFSEWEARDWGLSFIEGLSGRIERISCSPEYAGRYKQIFYPGMSVGQIIGASNKQLFIHGMIVIDGEFGVFFEVPETYDGEQYDDIDAVNELPDDMILERIHVMPRDWWK